MHKISAEVDAYVHVDEFLQIFNTYPRQKYAPLPQQNYVRLLLTRAFLINTVFFQVFAQLMIDLYGQPDRDYSYVIRFARLFGMAQQLVNDNCDYLPVGYGYSTVCKWPEDTFSDMRRRLVTLPVIAFFLKTDEKNGEIFSHYAGDNINLDLKGNDDQEWLFHHLKSSGAVSYAMGLLNCLEKESRKFVKDEIFQDMFSFVKANRYYKAYLEFNYS